MAGVLLPPANDGPELLNVFDRQGFDVFGCELDGSDIPDWIAVQGIMPDRETDHTGQNDFRMTCGGGVVCGDVFEEPIDTAGAQFVQSESGQCGFDDTPVGVAIAIDGPSACATIVLDFVEPHIAELG
ncbi:hypothetical protein ACX80S_01375 [Arthrobacter sp. RHLT1-20]